MDGLRGIAQQHRALPHQRARQYLDQRIGTARAGVEQAARPPADGLLQALQPGGVIQRHHRLCLVTGNPVHGAEMAVATRQQRRRAGIGETLPGGAIGRALAAHAGHEQRLLEVVAINVDAQRIAHAAAGAVGTDHQPRQQHPLATVIGHPHLAVAVNHLAQAKETHRPVAAQP